MYVYIHIYIYVCIYIYVYIYMYNVYIYIGEERWSALTLPNSPPYILVLRRKRLTKHI